MAKGFCRDVGWRVALARLDKDQGSIIPTCSAGHLTASQIPVSQNTPSPLAAHQTYICGATTWYSTQELAATLLTLTPRDACHLALLLKTLDPVRPVG